MVGEARSSRFLLGRQRFARYVLQTWLPNHQIEAHTREAYTGIVEKYLVPRFGKMPVNEVRPSDVREFFTALKAKGVSVHAIRKCKTVLGAIFTTAHSDELITLHPCTGVRAPLAPVKPLKVITPEQFDRLHHSVKDPRWRLMVELAVESGLRWGEVSELRVRDLSVMVQQLTVARVVVEVSPRFRVNGQRFLVKEYPKNGRYRQVRLREAITVSLAQHIVRLDFTSEDLLFGITPISEVTAGRPQQEIPDDLGMTDANPAGCSYRHGTTTGYTLGRCRCEACRLAMSRYRAGRRAMGKDRPPTARHVGIGGHVPHRWFLGKVWHPALEAANLGRRVVFHHLRHAHGSWILAGGATVQDVRERLGHRSLRATERYLHSLPDGEDNALDALARTREGSKQTAGMVAATCSCAPGESNRDAGRPFQA
ncbi:site-specific integrase [Crossiella sp. SN42]|uniref:tyrosine-type recombinase/integrase n=1 Tax=Crossiella sp. SN42 TaxID=2944808 RepID=UPI00207CDA5B|nr:tyrosine-type recombinase/integrase [Crossiella sp. SN42]MCO1575614.1 site-specific integrase [Crossiella sp. SN42]